MRRRHAFPALTAAGTLFLLLTPTPASAHGDTVNVVVTGQREGHVTTAITWENDGDPIEEAVGATVNATSPDGSRTLGPWRLVREPGSPTGWDTAEALPAGTWKVTVDVGFPSLGHGEREVSVPVVDPTAPGTPPSASTAPSQGPSPQQTPAQTPAQTPSPRPSAPPAGGGTDGKGDGKGNSGAWWTTAGVAVTALAGTGVGLLLRRARARRR